jgi:hypothetical protein
MAWSIRPCCSMALNAFSASPALRFTTTPPPAPATWEALSASPPASAIGTFSTQAVTGTPAFLPSALMPALMALDPGVLLVKTTSFLAPLSSRYWAVASAL